MSDKVLMNLLSQVLVLFFFVVNSHLSFFLFCSVVMIRGMRMTMTFIRTCKQKFRKLKKGQFLSFSS